MRPLRRLHAPRLFAGAVPLDAAQARHARDVLRLRSGESVEIFDDAGALANGTLEIRGTGDVLVHVERVTDASSVRSPNQPRVVIASAIPKGDRADWMIEKLSELGVDTFVPLVTERSVVRPGGANKRDRWVRLATESAKQSRRPSVLRLESVTTLAQALEDHAEPNHVSFVLSPIDAAPPLSDALVQQASTAERVTFFIGPEGGWTDGELALMDRAGVRTARLTQTILRVETAAMAAAVLALALNPGRKADG